MARYHEIFPLTCGGGATAYGLWYSTEQTGLLLQDYADVRSIGNSTILTRKVIRSSTSKNLNILYYKVQLVQIAEYLKCQEKYQTNPLIFQTLLPKSSIILKIFF